MVPLFFGFLIFLQNVDLPSDPIDIQTIQQQYEQRQQDVLKDMAASEPTESVPDSLIQGSALLFSHQDSDRANLLLRSFDSTQENPYSFALILRLLYSFQKPPVVLDLSVKNYLESVMAGWIQSSDWIQSADEQKPTSGFQGSEIDEIVKNSLGLLWAQYVEEATPEYKWPDKKSNSEHKKNLSRKTHQWLEQRIRTGFTERSSPITNQCMSVLLNLRDWSEDAALKIKADAVIDILVSDLAQESLFTQWGGVHCRDLESFYAIRGNRMQRILFGWPSSGERDSLDDSLVLPLCVSKYRPPSILVRLARECHERGTYESKNRFPGDPRNRAHAESQKKYSYVTPSFILSSFLLRDERVPWLSRPWDLMILDEDGNGHHVFTFTGNELASGKIDTQEENYFLWNATCFQYKNVLFSRFGRCDRIRANSGSIRERIDERYIQLPTRVWIPNSFAPIHEAGSWWFSQLGSVYVAFRPISGRSYWWQTSDPDTGNGNSTSLLSFQDLFTSFLLEVENASQFSSFDDFKDQMTQTPLKMDQTSLTFVSRRGDVFLFPLQEGNFMVNGHEVDLSEDPHYKLFNSPFIQSDYDSGYLKAEWQEYSLTIDIRDPAHPLRIVNPN